MPPDNRLTVPLASQVEQLPPSWRTVLNQPQTAEALKSAATYIQQRLAAGVVIYPAHPFRALEQLEPAGVRVVILGQDPYHGWGQAQGLAFSVPNDCARPPSLRNIHKELALEYPHSASASNDLSGWAQQGVLLLNTVLTVEDGKPASHAKRGWETVTDAVIAHVARDSQPKVFMLWGAHAQAKHALLPPCNGHLVLRANHPSPLSARRPPIPFLGCGHFRQANEWLVQRGYPAIAWVLPKKSFSRSGKSGYNCDAA
jgi:uracil-DNA glycosylase